MDEEITDRIIKYMLHDLIGNVEGEIAEFDAEKLQEAEDAGAVFIAVYGSGRREVVKAADIVEPKPMLNGTVLVTPPYVDDRMLAVVDVFDALASELAAPAAMLMSAEEPRRADFAAALEKLKELVLRGTVE